VGIKSIWECENLKELGAYCEGYWNKATISPEQKAVWLEAMEGYHFLDVRTTANRLFQTWEYNNFPPVPKWEEHLRVLDAERERIEKPQPLKRDTTPEMVQMINLMKDINTGMTTRCGAYQKAKSLKINVDSWIEDWIKWELPCWKPFGHIRNWTNYKERLKLRQERALNEPTINEQG